MVPEPDAVNEYVIDGYKEKNKDKLTTEQGVEIFLHRFRYQQKTEKRKNLLNDENTDDKI
jgi:hypothetical protein